MKLSYFDDTDTPYIEFKESEAAETKDSDENALFDLDDQGQVIAISVSRFSAAT